MSTYDRLDPELQEGLKVLLDAMPGGLNAVAEIVPRRKKLQDTMAAMTAHIEPNPNVTIEDRTIPGPEGAPDVAVRLYRKVGAPSPAPGVLYIHGGGMIMGDLSMGELSVIRMCDETGATFVSVDYRLAPENPYPAAVEDCYAALAWTAANRGDLGIRPGGLAIVGGSAGGGLTIATSLVARDRGGPAVGFQMPFYPMIDDRNETPSSHEITDLGVWDRAGNIEAWGWYLGGKPADGYAAPARMENLAGLPPTYLDVGTEDLFRDENIAFAGRLVSAGVPTEFHLWPGAFHASETFAPGATLSRLMWVCRLAALKRALAG
ncbi:MAG: alpha/beta hydrolase [Minwuia sp.]|uniref:alpha/beta hydrolase n=1 Tax=Minwuia sp. TaxID=2493630 RepID=UPI003A8B64E2